MLSQDCERVLVIVAHPDDAEFWAGGTIACWADAGVEVRYCVLTNGDAGGFDPSLARHELPRIRQTEQHKAAAVLGVGDIEFFCLAEGGPRQHSHDLHIQLVRMIRRARPDIVVTWSPEWNWQRFRSCHPDHLATGAAVLAAIYPDAGNPFALPWLRETEGLEAWTVREAWLLNSPQREVNHYMDITATFDRKVAAVRAHASQVKDPDTLAVRPRERIAPNSAAAGLPEDKLVEAFQVVVTG